jgi:hypothetical protein
MGKKGTLMTDTDSIYNPRNVIPAMDDDDLEVIFSATGHDTSDPKDDSYPAPSEAEALSFDLLTCQHTLFDAIRAAEKSALEIQQTEWMLQCAKNRVLLDNAENPKALGHNEATREAALSEQISTFEQNLMRARRVQIVVRGDLERAKLGWDAVKLRLRLLEVKAGLKEEVL